MLIHRTSDKFILDFKFSPFLLKRVKEDLPVRYFNYATKQWWVPLHQEKALTDFAKKRGFTFVDAEPQEQIPEVIDYTMPELTMNIPLKMNLFPYQRTGVQYAIDKKRLIIGDKMGLGKTAQAIATITGAHAFPCLVVCPATLKTNWEREWQMWTTHRARVINESIFRHMDRWVEAGTIDVFIINFESLKKYFVESIKKNDAGRFRISDIQFNRKINLFKSVVIDESHKCKDFKTQQTKFTTGICKGKEYVLALTGTAVINKPKDLMAQLHIIDRLKDLGGYKPFKDRYCAGEKEASNLKELNWRLLNTCFFSRNKEDVLKDLPAKIRQVVYCDMDAVHWQEYRDAEADLEGYLLKYREATDEKIASAMRGEVMVRIGILKDIAARGKLAGGVKDFISETIYDNGEKLVVFAHQHKVFDQLLSWFPEALTITGRDSFAERQVHIDRFQQDDNCKLILCSIQAAGVGITLTASSRVSFVELGWHSAIHDQAEDRCHRIGQQNSVQCTYFLAKDTIDLWVFDLIEKKREMVAAITGGNLDAVEVNVVDNIIELFNKNMEVQEV